METVQHVEDAPQVEDDANEDIHEDEDLQALTQNTGNHLQNKKIASYGSLKPLTQLLLLQETRRSSRQTM